MRLDDLKDWEVQHDHRVHRASTCVAVVGRLEKEKYDSPSQN